MLSNANWVIIQLYHDENKIYFNEYDDDDDHDDDDDDDDDDHDDDDDDDDILFCNRPTHCVEYM